MTGNTVRDTSPSASIWRTVLVTPVLLAAEGAIEVEGSTD
jgi:hypothetical protein